jgi:hypothetical protein
MIVDIALIAVVFEILIQVLFIQVCKGYIYDSRLMVLQFLQAHLVVRTIYIIVVDSYPHLSIIAMLDAAKLRAEGHKPHTHAPHAHAD